MNLNHKNFLKPTSSLLVFSMLFMTGRPLAFADPLPGELPAGFQGDGSYETAGGVGTLNAPMPGGQGSFESFNVGSEATFNAFINNAYLASVNSQSPSEIFGNMNVSGGRFFLVNTSGIYFAPGASVNASGLVVSSLNISNEDFADEVYHFTQNSGGPELTVYNDPAFVVNEGSINIGEGGVVLIGGTVRNSGRITAYKSSVILAAGREMTLSFDGSGLIQVVVDRALVEKVFERDGTQAKNGVLNDGVIVADGGRVVMTAEAASGVFDKLVNNEGLVQADTVSNKNGVVELVSNSDGIVSNSGSLIARGNDLGEKGGQVVLSGEKTGFLAGLIDVAGHAGGGTALIGGDYQGLGLVRNAFVTYFGPLAMVLADALTEGDGGKVIVWAQQMTEFFGKIFARGGVLFGNGGFAEISGKNLTYRGETDLSAPAGEWGTILFDPVKILFQAGTADGSDDEGGSLSTLFKEGNDNDVTYTETVTASNPFIVYESELNNTNANMSFQATNSVAVGGTFAVGGVTLQNNRSITIQTRNSSGEGSTGIDLVSGATNFAITTTGTGSITIESGTNGGDAGDAPITLCALTTASGSVTVDAEGTLTVSGALKTGNLASSGTTGSIDLTSQNAGVVINANVTTGSVSVADSTGGQTARSGDIAVTAGTSITGTGSLITGDGEISGASGTGSDKAQSGSITLTATSGSGGIGLGNATALKIGSATRSGGGAGTDTVTSGDITLKSKDEINNGTASTALSLQIGTASGGSIINQGTLALVQTTGSSGNVFLTSASDLNLSDLKTGSGAHMLSFSTTGGADLNVLNASNTISEDSVTLDAGTGDLTFGDNNFNVGSGSLTLIANEINFTGGNNSVRGSGGALVIRPGTAGQDILLGGAADSGASSLDITITDWNAIQSGFGGITVGRSDGSGTFTVSSDPGFDDPLTLQMPLGTLNINADLTAADDASITLKGSAISLDGDITTKGQAIEFFGDVTLGSGSTILLDTTDGGSAGAEIHFNNMIDGVTDYAENLTLTAGTGNILFDGAIGSLVKLGAILIESAADVAADAISAASLTQVAGTGTTDFNGALDIDGDIDLTGNIFNVNGSVETTSGGKFEITHTDTFTLADNAPGYDMVIDGDFTDNGPGTTVLLGTILAANTGFTFNNPVILAADLILSSGGIDIIFNNTVTGPYSLILTAAAGSIFFNMAVNIAELIINSAKNVEINSTFNATGITQTTGTGTTTFSGAATVTGDVDITNGSISFSGATGSLDASGYTAELEALTGGVTGGDAAVDVTGDTLVVRAVTGIDLNTDVDTLTATTTGVGDINIDELDDVVLTLVSTFDGDITLHAGDTVTATSVEAGGAGNDVDLTADAGDVLADSIIAANQVSVTATSGAILESGADAAADIEAKDVVLSALNGIGTKANPLEINFTGSTLSAQNNGDGDIAIDATTVDDVEITNAAITGVGDVIVNLLTDLFALTVKNASTANGSITLTSLFDLIVDGNITSGGVNAGTTLTADSESNGIGDLMINGGSVINGGGGPIQLSGAGITILGTLITAGPFSLTAIGNLILGFISAESFNLNVGNDILDANGDANNLNAGNTSSLRAGGVIGSAADPIEFTLASGNLNVIAQGLSSAGSAFLHGFLPGLMILGNVTPGLVLFNNQAIGGATLPNLNSNRAALFNLPAFLAPLTYLNDTGALSGLLAGHGFLRRYATPITSVIDTRSLEGQPLVVVDESEAQKWVLRIPAVAPVQAPVVAPTPIPAAPPTAVAPTPIAIPVAVPKIVQPPAVARPTPTPVSVAKPTPQPQAPFIQAQPQIVAPQLATQPFPGAGPFAGGRLFQQGVEEQPVTPEEKPAPEKK